MNKQVAHFQSSNAVDDSKILWRALLAAFCIEFTILTVIGWHESWLSHAPKTGLDSSKFIEAEVFQTPQDSHLVEEKQPTIAHAPREATISKVPDQGKVAKPGENKIQEENQTNAGAKLAPTHGPVAVFSPPPVIPPYLRDKDLHTSVVIDFFINAQGTNTPRLVGSSGSEELDAVAIAAVKKWQFRPAENDHKPVDAKVRLRIVFEVK